MQLAIGLYDGFTALDVIGPYQVFANHPGVDVVFCADRTGPIHDDVDRLRVQVDTTFADVPAPDILLVGGGFVTRRLAAERAPIVELDRGGPPRDHVDDVGVHRLAAARRGRAARRRAGHDPLVRVRPAGRRTARR